MNTGFAEANVSFGQDEKTLVYTSNYNLGRFSAYSVHATHDAANSYQSYSLDILGMEDFLFRVRVADLTQQTVTQIVEYVGEGHSVDLSIHKDKRYAVLGDAGIWAQPSFPVLVAMDKPLPLLAVDFEPKSSNLLPVGELQLQQLAQFINHTSDCVVELVVNVAGRDDELSYNLSLERGRVMRSVLTTAGVDASRITVSAYGNVNTKNGATPGVAVRFRER